MNTFTEIWELGIVHATGGSHQGDQRLHLPQPENQKWPVGIGSVRICDEYEPGPILTRNIPEYT
jgi:hypothetical protein